MKNSDAAPPIFRKPHLLTKICVTCGRPFEWRKKWARVWEEVRFCSERCRRNKPQNSKP